MSGKGIAKNTIMLYVRMLVVLMVSLYTTRVVLAELGVIDYGVYNVVAGFVSMFGFMNTSLSNAIQRYYNFSIGCCKGEDLSKWFTSALIIQFLIGVCAVIVLESVGICVMYHGLNIPEERLYAGLFVFHSAVVSTFVLFLQAPFQAAIIASERMSFFAWISILEVFGKLSIVLLLSMLTWDKLIVYSVLYALVSLFVCVSYVIFVGLKLREYRISFSLTRAYFKSLFSFSGWNILGTLAYMMKGQGVNVILNVYFGPIVNAARGISNMIQGAIQSFASNIVLAYRPQLIQEYASNNNERVRNLFFSMSNVSYLVLALLSIIIIFEFDYITTIWLGADAPEYTKVFTIMILINMCVSSLNTPLSLLVHATGKMARYQVATSIVVLLIIPVSWIVLELGAHPEFVYVVSLCIAVLNQIVCCRIVQGLFDYGLKSYINRVIIPSVVYTVISCICAFCVHIIAPPSLWRIFGMAGCLTIYSGLWIYLVVISKSERIKFNTIIRRYVS